ncbi:MAG: hypothetical protein NVSMB24_24350 [Mucilaginibacter sp.]
MNSQKVFEFLIQAGIGVFLAIIAFFTKSFMDYSYLKSPRLKPTVKVRGTAADRSIGGNRLYSFQITINIHNNSKNDAYDFELIEFKPTEVFEIIRNPLNIDKFPITDQKSLSIVIEYQAILQEKNGFVYQDAHERLNEIDKKFHIKYSYSNALGKPYTQSHDGEMTAESFSSSFIY